MITQAEHDSVLAENRALVSEINEVKAELAMLRRMIFGRRSEKFAPADEHQLGLFDPAGRLEVDEAHPASPTAAADVTPPTRKHPGRAALPEHFPVEVEIVAPDFRETPGVPSDPDALSDDKLAVEGYDLIGFETSRRVAYRPAQYRIIEQRRPKYRHRASGAIVVAHARDRVLARAVADESLAADVICKKYLDHLPLYRQCEALRRDHAWAVSRATVGKWVQTVAVTLRPLYDRLVASIMAADYLQMDESGIRVLAADEPRATHQGYMWLVRDPVSGAVAMRYHKGRSAAVPREMLAGYRGVLQVDGYVGYTRALTDLLEAGRITAQQIRQVGCLAHIRRKFYDARASDARAAEALAIIQRIYRLEDQWRRWPPENRVVARQKHLAPTFAELTAWLDGVRGAVTPKTPLAKAIVYALHQWPSLAVVLEDGRVEVDNNGIENEVRPLALGRKNYLFAGNHGAAQNSAALYSLLLSCKAIGVNPRAWLIDTLDRILTHPVNRVEELLPSHYARRPQDVVG